MTVATLDRSFRLPSVPPDADGLKVLVVDDNPGSAEALARLLEAAGHAVRLAYDGTAAVAATAVAAPDVLLLDIGLPGVDGWEVARRVRAAPGGPSCFIVAVTAHDTDNDRRRSRQAGVDLHLAKPVNGAALVGMLDGYRLT